MIQYSTVKERECKRESQRVGRGSSHRHNIVRVHYVFECYTGFKHVKKENI